MDRNDKQAADKPLIEAIRGKLDNATRMITSLQAEIAALRGDLPEGWELDADDGQYTSTRLPGVMWVNAWNNGHTWGFDGFGEQCRSDEPAPTLLAAIAACEAARGAK